MKIKLPIENGDFRRILSAILLIGLTTCGFFWACQPHAVTETVLYQEVGPYGGTVLGPKGSKLVIPQGALEETILVGIRELTEDEIWRNDNYFRISSAFQITPDNYQLVKAATVEMPYLPLTLTDDQQETLIHGYSSPRWRPNWKRLDGTVETKQHVYRMETTRFAAFSIYLTDAPLADGDEDLEEENEVEACACEIWDGEWCSESPCLPFSRIVVEAAETTGCRRTLVLHNEGGAGSQTAGLSGCESMDSIPFTFQEYGECWLSFDESGSSMTLDCPNCRIEFRMDACP